MSQEALENYSTGYNKDEVYLKRIHASLKASSQPFWALIFVILVLIGVDMASNGWMGWNEFFLRSLSAAILLSISYLISPNLPDGTFNGELQPDNYAHAILVMKNYYRITFLKVLRLLLFHTTPYLVLGLLLRSDASLTMKDFLSIKWFSANDSMLVIIGLMFIFTLILFHSRYTRLDKIEHNFNL